MSWLVYSIGCVSIGQHCLGGGSYDIMDNIVFVVVDVCLLDSTNQEDDGMAHGKALGNIGGQAGGGA